MYTEVLVCYLYIIVKFEEDIKQCRKGKRWEGREGRGKEGMGSKTSTFIRH